MTPDNRRTMEKNCPDNLAWRFKVAREHYDADVSAYGGQLLAEHRDDASVIYSRLSEIEDRLIPNGDYLIGSARVEDDLLVLHGLSRVLLTAEHATIQRRTRNGETKQKETDMGTGALAEAVSQDTNATAIIAIGRQTADANDVAKHLVKDAMKEVIELPQNRAHFSLHMLDRGRASDPEDLRGYSVMLGIGNKPSEATLALKDYLLDVGRDLNLRVGVNQPHITFQNRQLRLNEDGSLHTVTFAGAGPNTTRTYSQDLAEKKGKDDSYAAVQMEINEVLLVRQNDEVNFPKQIDLELGAYIGYLFTKLAVEQVARL